MNKINLFTHNWLIYKILNDSVNHHLHLIKGRVLDLGYGTAPYKEDILKVADEYNGVDWKNTLHDQSKIDVFCDLSQRFLFEDNYADTLVSFEVMEHLPEPDFFLSECYRILRPGGRILITVPFMWHVHEAPYDYFRYTRHGMEYLLKKNGFSEIEIKENTGFWQMMVLKFNYHTAYHTARYARGPFKLLLVFLWFMGQVIASLLDKFDRDANETAGYTILAKK